MITPGLGDSGAVGWAYTVADIISDGTMVSGHGIPEGPMVTVIVPGMGGMENLGVGLVGELSVTVKVESRNGLMPREKSF